MSQVFSQAHLRVNFIGSMKLPWRSPAARTNRKPFVKLCGIVLELSFHRYHLVPINSRHLEVHIARIKGKFQIDALWYKVDSLRLPFDAGG